ncbi:hypothetical protein PENSPDRAFT_646982 [Peniophora sp. CONT]|nr:hypothetical protein PENSPDRAFT_646982 [Peniophora sp. CONT]
MQWAPQHRHVAVGACGQRNPLLFVWHGAPAGRAAPRLRLSVKKARTICAHCMNTNRDAPRTMHRAGRGRLGLSSTHKVAAGHHDAQSSKRG